MIDLDEILKTLGHILFVACVAWLAFSCGRETGKKIADPHQCISVCLQVWEDLAC